MTQENFEAADAEPTEDEAMESEGIGADSEREPLMATDDPEVLEGEESVADSESESFIGVDSLDQEDLQDEPERRDEGVIEEEASETETAASATSALENAGGTITQIGQINAIRYYFGTEEERAFLVPLSTAEVRRLQDIFVAPPDFERWRRQRGDARRIFLVHGREHAGKLTCAVKAILERTDSPPERLAFLSFRRPSANSPTLDTFLWGKEANQRAEEASIETVYLAEDCFTDRLIELSVLAGSLEELEDQLFKLKSYLVLTSEWMEDLAELNLEKVSAENAALDDVFEKHLLRYLSGDEAVRMPPEGVEIGRRLWPEIRSRFHFPVQVRTLCHRLGELGFGASEDEIQRAVDEAAHVGRPRVRSWFRRLRPNQRLFALLTSLFSGLERQDLEFIYAAAIGYLRESGIVGLEDARQAGQMDLLEAIYARVESSAMPQFRGPLLRTQETDEIDDLSPAENGAAVPTENGAELYQIIAFVDRSIDDEMRRQVRNYSNLLWSLRPLFLRLARERQGATYWRFRKSLGAAIGQLGASNHGEMIELLQELAIGRSGEVTAVAGAALGQSFATDHDFQSRGLQLLARWIRDPELTWAAALAVWRAYYGILEAASRPERVDAGARAILDRLLGILEKIVSNSERWGRREQRIASESTSAQARSRAHHERLIRNWLRDRARRNRDGATYALWMIARVDPSAVITLIDRWFGENPQTRLPEVAEVTAVGLFREAGERRPSRDAVELLLSIFPRLLASEVLSFDSLGIVMRTLRTWNQWEVRDLSFRGLLQVANRCPEGGAQRFCLAIVRFWLDEPGSSQETHIVAQALLARILVMDGAPVGPLSGNPGLILLDGAGRIEIRKLADAARRLYWLLQALGDVEIRLLGSTSALVGAGEAVGLRQLIGSARPRLVIPAVEALGKAPAFVLALGSGEILDLDEALRAPWAGRLIVAVPAKDSRMIKEGRHPSGAEIVFIDPDRPDKVLWAMLERTIVQRFRLFASDATEGAEGWFTEIFSQSATHADLLWRRILIDIERLDEPGVGCSDDPARHVLPALLWQARIDPGGYVERMQAWLGEDLGPRRSIAGASGRMLFGTIGLGGWRPPVATHGCLFHLAEKLAEQWSGANSILVAALALVEDDDWRSFLCGRPNGIVFTWFRRLRPELRTRLADVARDWNAGEGGEEIPPAVRVFAEEIRRLTKQGGGLTLPLLPLGGTHRILIVDADSDSLEQMKRVTHLAAKAVKDSPRSAAHPWVILRLGSCALTGLEEKISSSDLLGDRGRPRLLLPLLNSLPMDAVALVLVIAAAPPLDEDDLVGSAWLRKAYLHVTDKRWSKGGLLTRVPILLEAGELSSTVRSLLEAPAGNMGSSVAIQIGD